jgi:DNA-directed RNA polymerase specialized sigma24 family protein
METTTYTALCERAGRWWTITVPQIEVLPDAPAPVARALQARHAARQAAEAAGKATREAIEALARDGYPFHDAATMLSLSRGEIEHYGPHAGEAAPAGSGPLPASAG